MFRDGASEWSEPGNGLWSMPKVNLYFGVALQCLPGMLTLTSGMTAVVKRDRRLRLLKAPQELHAFHFLMVWHQRQNTDPRHVWLREPMRSTSAGVNG
jgi:hypothetical protein